ncbi:MAG: hypothetical protein HYV27_14690 [Candidatus Hydrogenedentes bacterium]|nr:hypothetical protein [Candidatus Hydrogenedentota bacterium]
MRRIGSERPTIARGWFILAGAICGLTLAGWLDRDLKTATVPGFIPAEAAWSIYTPDFPAAWHWFEREPAWAPLRDTFPTQILDPRLRLRQVSGVRFTPARWRTWFGPSLLMHGNAVHWGAVVKPGLLLRCAHYIAGAPVPDSRGLYQWHGYYYGWREGFLLISPSQDWTRETLEGTVDAANAAPASMPLIRLQRRGDHPASFTLRCAPGAPFSGTAAIPIQTKTRQLELPFPGGDPPMLLVEGASLQQIEAFRRGVVNYLAPLCVSGPKIDLPAPFSLLATAYAQLAGRNIDNGAGIALHDVAWMHGIPVPVLALVLDDPEGAGLEHPFSIEAPGLVEEPYRWDGVAGSVTPLWGDGMALWRARKTPYWIAATQADTVAALLRGDRTAEAPYYVSLFLGASWPKLADAASAALTRAEEWGLFTEWLDAEIRRAVTPFAESVAQLTRIEVYIEGTGDALRFTGFLNAPRAEEAAGS